MAHGQRYQSGDPRYDAYFDEVHRAQVGAAAWPAEKKAARRSLVEALALVPDASDETVVRGTRERVSKLDSATGQITKTTRTTKSEAIDAPLLAAVSETARVESARARSLKETREKLEALARHGEELRKTEAGSHDLTSASHGRTTEKSREVRRELGGAVEIARTLSREASRRAREAQEFVDDLEAALDASGKRRPRPDHDESRSVQPRRLLEPKPASEEKKTQTPKPSKPTPRGLKPTPATAEKTVTKPEAEATKPPPARPPTPTPKPVPERVSPPKPEAQPEEVFSP